MGLAPSRERAKTTVMAGNVFVDGQRVDKPGTAVSPESNIEVRGETLKYVSRGGLKLEKALQVFEFDPSAVTFYKLEYKATEGGYIAGTALQTLRENSEGSAVTAIPNEGYRFVGWSDGKTSATRTDIATSNMTITAIFENWYFWRCYRKISRDMAK